MAVAMIGKLAVSILFAFAYFWSSEVFPSTLRTTLVGFCSLLARIGSMAAPAIVDLVSKLNKRLLWVSGIALCSSMQLYAALCSSMQLYAALCSSMQLYAARALGSRLKDPVSS